MNPGLLTTEKSPAESVRAGDSSHANTTTPGSSSRLRWIWRLLIGAVVAGLLLFLGRSLLAGLLNDIAQSALQNRQQTLASAAVAVSGFLHHQNPRTHFLSAVACRRDEDFASTRRHLGMALELGWDADAIRRQELLAFAQTRDFSKVDGHWDELFLSAAGDGPEISEAFAELLLSRFEVSSALRILDAWQSDFPKDPGPHMMRGKILAVIRNWKGAEAEYQLAAGLDVDNSDALLEVARCRMEQVNFEGAAAVLTELMDRGNRSSDVIVRYAMCLRKLQRIDAATLLLQNNWAQVRDNVDALREMGRARLEAEQPEEALSFLSQAVEIRPIDREIRYLYAQALQAAGRPQDAQKEFDFVNEATQPTLRLAKMMPELVADPNNIELRFELAEITWNYKSRDEGLHWFQSLLHLDPTHRPTHLALAKHYEEVGDHEQAARHRAVADTANVQ